MLSCLYDTGTPNGRGGTNVSCRVLSGELVSF